MAVSSKPLGGAVFSIFFLLQFVAFVSAIKIDAKSCTPYKARLDGALTEVEAMVDYAIKRANDKTYKRQGTLLQDMLHASNEDDTLVLRKVAAGFTEVQKTLKSNNIVIHCDDKHLTKSTATLYYDNSNGRQARVQVLNNAKRDAKLGACGGIQRAFAYAFFDAKTKKEAGEAIVLCSDAKVGALLSANPTKKLGDFRGNDLAKVSQGLDMAGSFLSYMILHELMHATDHKSFPVNPGNKAELYGSQEITGHADGGTGATGPDSLTRIANADSWALLASGWYMNNHKVENGKWVTLGKADRVPAILKRALGLNARGTKKAKTTKAAKTTKVATTKAAEPTKPAAEPTKATSKAPAPAQPTSKSVTVPKTTSKVEPPKSSVAPPASSKASSAAPASSAKPSSAAPAVSSKASSAAPVASSKASSAAPVASSKASSAAPAVSSKASSVAPASSAKPTSVAPPASSQASSAAAPASSKSASSAAVPASSAKPSGSSAAISGTAKPSGSSAVASGSAVPSGSSAAVSGSAKPSGSSAATSGTAKPSGSSAATSGTAKPSGSSAISGSASGSATSAPASASASGSASASISGSASAPVSGSASASVSGSATSAPVTSASASSAAPSSSLSPSSSSDWEPPVETTTPDVPGTSFVDKIDSITEKIEAVNNLLSAVDSTVNTVIPLIQDLETLTQPPPDSSMSNPGVWEENPTIDETPIDDTTGEGEVPVDGEPIDETLEGEPVDETLEDGEPVDDTLDPAVEGGVTARAVPTAAGAFDSRPTGFKTIIKRGY